MQPQDPVTVTVKPDELPLYCSGPADAAGWNGHPRVFLPAESYGRVECPYCGTVYLIDGEIKGHH